MRRNPFLSMSVLLNQATISAIVAHFFMSSLSSECARIGNCSQKFSCVIIGSSYIMEDVEEVVPLEKLHILIARGHVKDTIEKVDHLDVIQRERWKPAVFYLFWENVPTFCTSPYLVIVVLSEGCRLRAQFSHLLHCQCFLRHHVWPDSFWQRRTQFDQRGVSATRKKKGVQSCSEGVRSSEK